MKKYILNLNLCLVLSLALASCVKEDNLQPEGQWTLSQPIIVAPTGQDVVVLDESTPNETITFIWSGAESSEGYKVTYEVLIDTLGTSDFSTPILIKTPSNGGEATSLSITYQEIDDALAFSGFPSNTEASVSFAVRAKSLSKSSESVGTLDVVRFESETKPTRLFISGSATENQNNLSEAIQLRRLTDENGLQSNMYEIYTSLVAGESYKFYSERSLPALQFGGNNGVLESFGDHIVANNSGQYRIRVNLDNMTYELLQINFWSIVGSPIVGGCGGDEALEYQGNSIWKASINLVETGGFVFRANGDWAYLLKRVVGTNNTIVLESDAQNQGVSVEDIPSNLTGRYFVTLNLSANGYNYTFEEDNTVVEPIATPEQLFLFENGNLIEEFDKNGDVFNLNKFIPMQSSAVYTLNSAADGNGTSYSVNGLLAQSTNPDGDSVSGSVNLVANSNQISLASDRALRLTINFGAPELTWTYYNFKLFHWQIWDDRVEHVMTYSHPNTYTVTANLFSGYDSKFISPWDFDLGSDNPSELNGNLINAGGLNLLNINTTGTYEVIMVLEDDYQSGTYEFVQQ
jgi:hypothetical protein